MTGILIGLWATPTMTVDHLLHSAGFTLYIWIGVQFEERALLRQLGQPYRDYCARVPSLVPSVARLQPPADPSAAPSNRLGESS
jgi:protein-S-isoprenylcysteine O-methyltransferase Ste14